MSPEIMVTPWPFSRSFDGQTFALEALDLSIAGCDEQSHERSEGKSVRLRHDSVRGGGFLFMVQFFLNQ